MSCPALYGWPLFYKHTIQDIIIQRQDITNETDVIILFVHWFLNSKHNFQFLGQGDQKNLADGEIGSPYLPTNWNTVISEPYSFRYVSNNIVHVLLVRITSDTMVLNLSSSASLVVPDITVNIKDTVQALIKPIVTMGPNIEALVFGLEMVPIPTSENERANWFHRWWQKFGTYCCFAVVFGYVVFALLLVYVGYGWTATIIAACCFSAIIILGSFWYKRANWFRRWWQKFGTYCCFAVVFGYVVFALLLVYVGYGLTATIIVACCFLVMIILGSILYYTCFH